MNKLLQIKKSFHAQRHKIFSELNKDTDSLEFSKKISILIENCIREIIADDKYNFAVAAAGSFSRRELSPYSDVDLMIITEKVEKDKQNIVNLITKLFDAGIEVSHTVREPSDIIKFRDTDLHAFTQFFETRFIAGNSNVYANRMNELISSIDESVKKNLLRAFIEDQKMRYAKYGDSPKMLEPNLKLSAGGLRDLQSIEWMFILEHKDLINWQFEQTQTEALLSVLTQNKYTTAKEAENILSAYTHILKLRHFLHLLTKSKTDRFEFTHQQKLLEVFGLPQSELRSFMKEYFEAANTIYRFSKSVIKKYLLEILEPVPDALAFSLDDDFYIKGKVIHANQPESLSFSDILRAYYYRGLHNAYFDDSLRRTIVDKVHNQKFDLIESESSVFFREILRLPRNVGDTLYAMNELGVLGAFLPEFRELNGFMQAGVYHCYTADEHTLVTIKNLEKLANDNSHLGKIYRSTPEKEILFLAMIFHDIAKPINIAGHELFGAEIASSVMYRLGYSEREVEKVAFLVRNHLLMEQVAFRRNLNDPETLNSFILHFNSSTDELDLLYLVTYADLSAVNPAVWTTWKSELLYELYRKSRAMITDKISGEELLYSNTYIVPKEISKHSDLISETDVKEHLESMHDDVGYTSHFSEAEIAKHIEEIGSEKDIAVMFKEFGDYTNITIITKDFPALLSKLCGVLAINDVNIHDAKIFTRNDGIVIDTFNVTDFSSHKKVDPSKYDKIQKDFENALTGYLEVHQEVSQLKARWKRLEQKLFGRSGQVKVSFDNHERYTIIDVFSPDRLGFLYHITRKMSELGLIIHFAKISTKGDDIVDSFYVLNQRGKKISQSDLAFIQSELIKTIEQIL
ncbi:HD domain-containing protein [Ignavibacterium sp.]|uniref:[protein-PII] uridylyltransferase family protein n=1 Tax=Ignavibacterium sp. TaxID=2651167 RepID=UPI00307F551D